MSVPFVMMMVMMRMMIDAPLLSAVANVVEKREDDDMFWGSCSVLITVYY